MKKAVDTSKAIAVVGSIDEWKIETSQTVTEARDAAIKRAGELKPIQDEDGLRAALEVKRELRAIRKGVEDVVKALKKPLNEMKASIAETAEAWLAKLVSAENNTEGMINNFQNRQLEAQEQAQKAKAAEIQQQAERTGGTLENLTALRDRHARMCEAMNKEGADSADIEELKALEDEITEAELAYESLPDAEKVTAALAATVKVKGVNSKRVLDFKVKGDTERERWENTVAFCQAYPELCNIEIRVSDVRKRLNEGDCFKSTFPEEQPQGEARLPRPPGIEVFEKVETRIR